MYRAVASSGSDRARRAEGERGREAGGLGHGVVAGRSRYRAEVGSCDQEALQRQPSEREAHRPEHGNLRVTCHPGRPPARLIHQRLSDPFGERREWRQDRPGIEIAEGAPHQELHVGQIVAQRLQEARKAIDRTTVDLGDDHAEAVCEALDDGLLQSVLAAEVPPDERVAATALGGDLPQRHRAGPSFGEGHAAQTQKGRLG